MRSIYDSYFPVLCSESVRKVLELHNIKDNEENIHFNDTTVHLHSVATIHTTLAVLTEVTIAKNSDFTKLFDS